MGGGEEGDSTHALHNAPFNLHNPLTSRGGFTSRSLDNPVERYCYFDDHWLALVSRQCPVPTCIFIPTPGVVLPHLRMLMTYTCFVEKLLQSGCDIVSHSRAWVYFFSNGRCTLRFAPCHSLVLAKIEPVKS